MPNHIMFQIPSKGTSQNMCPVKAASAFKHTLRSFQNLISNNIYILCGKKKIAAFQKIRIKLIDRPHLGAGSHCKQGFLHVHCALLSDKFVSHCFTKPHQSHLLVCQQLASHLCLPSNKSHITFLEEWEKKYFDVIQLLKSYILQDSQS